MSKPLLQATYNKKTNLVIVIRLAYTRILCHLNFVRLNKQAGGFKFDGLIWVGTCMGVEQARGKQAFDPFLYAPAWLYRLAK